MTRRDLEDYMPIIRDPIYGTYRGYEIISDAAALFRRGSPG